MEQGKTTFRAREDESWSNGRQQLKEEMTVGQREDNSWREGRQQLEDGKATFVAKEGDSKSKGRWQLEQGKMTVEAREGCKQTTFYGLGRGILEPQFLLFYKLYRAMIFKHIWKSSINSMN